MSKMHKPHKGTIESWRKIKLTKEEISYCSKIYGEKCGTYYIFGTCINHPEFGTTNMFRSSWIVKRRGNEIETRNSRYTLGKPYEV